MTRAVRGQDYAGRLAISIAALAVCGMAAEGRAGASATGYATATVVAPIGIAAAEPHLRFGAFSSTAGGQTITVAPDGTRILRGAREPGPAHVQPVAPARFTVSGESGMHYSVSLPARTEITTAHPGTAGAMQVTDFISLPGGADLLVGGPQSLRVGATLTTVPGQALGSYIGSFVVTVAYD